MEPKNQEALESLIKQLQRRIRILERQQALQGFNTPASIIVEIEDLQREIIDAQKQLKFAIGDFNQLGINYSQLQEEREHLEAMLTVYWRRLNLLDRRQDQLGLSVPPEIVIEIEDIRAKISNIEGELDTLLIGTRTQENASILILLDILVKHFNDEELRDLSFDLGVDINTFESINDSSIRGKARELLLHCTRNERILELVVLGQSVRPKVAWPDVGQHTDPVLLSTETVEVLAEAKLVLVGDGNVGKTSIVNQLVHDLYNPLESTTRGITISRWNLTLPHSDVRMARMNIWDFGGQGNMHATHPYFYSRRAVYLVVLNVREDDRINRVEYWLRLIRSYGMESPVIIISNKIDQFPTRLDERSLKDKYPSIFEFVRTSCETGQGISDLRDAIAKAVCTFDDIGVRTPQSMMRLKQTLEDMTDAKSDHFRDTLSLGEYDELCEQYNIDSSQRAGFLRRLHDLGVMLYFGDDARLELNAVLNPLWVTEGIYRIINHEAFVAVGGKVRLEQVREILPRDRYPFEKSMYILDMMRKFELCFSLDEQQTLFLLPDLLPPQQPHLPFIDREGVLQLQFEYPVWQGATLTRLLVRLNHYLVENMYWRNGALLQSSDKKNRALVIADESDRRLRIWVDGEMATRRNLLNRIREELNVIHGYQRDQIIKEWVVISSGGEIAYQLLIKLEEQGVKKYPILIDGNLVELDVEELLSGVRAEAIPDAYRLKELILERLSLDELDDLCFRFKISLEDIEGPMTKDAKSRNLIRQFERTRRMPELMSVLRELRKNVTWT